MLGLGLWCGKNSRFVKMLIFVFQVETEVADLAANAEESDLAANAEETKTAQSRKLKNCFKIKMARLPTSQSGIISKSAITPSINEIRVTNV